MLAATDYAGLGVLVASIGSAAAAIIAAIASLRTHQVAGDTKKAITMTNGQTIAEVTEANEGRRIEATIPAKDRTADERHYVDNLDRKSP